MSTLTTLDSEELIQLFELSDWQELALRVGDCELFLSKNRDSGASRSANGASPREPAGAGQEPAKAAESTGKNQAPPASSIVTAPSLGTFYRAPQRGAAPLVELDGQVGKDTELCVIEVMKRTTALRAGVAGTVREVYVKDGDLVEFAQPLFLIDTHG